MIGAVVSSPEEAVSTKPPNAVPSFSTSSRIWALADKLVICVHLNPFDVDSFCNLCISLSREVDNATVTNEVPDRVSELPSIFKLVCQRKNECSLQAAIMALMVTVKNACKALWFTRNESRELLYLANEVASIFCTPEGFSCEQANIISTVSQIMPRYYPLLKLGHVLASVAIKPGFEACAVDFHVSKNINCSAVERVRLLVAMKDNVDASCIINPSNANILINGVGLKGRIAGCMSLAPQLPTIVNHILTYGTNLLQAIGHFDAHYIVLVAVMSAIQTSDLPAPRDYLPPPAAAVDSDPEVIVGPSKITLNCPISFSRITKPVKGYLCKHLQCFDLSNYIEINSKRPSWRCPLCNQPVCYPDIRIDQKMLTILQEVGEGVTNVIVQSDGSWEATSGSDNRNDNSYAKAVEGLQSMQQLEAPGMFTGSSNVCDLTEGDDEIISVDVDAPEDRKASLQSKCMNPSIPSLAGEPSHVNQNSTQVQGIACSGPLGIHFGPADYNTRANPEAGIVTPAPVFRHDTPSAVPTDSVSPAANREQHAFLGTNQQSSSLTQIHPPPTNYYWLQQLNHTGGFVRPAPVFEHFTPAAITHSVSPAANRDQQDFLGTNQQSISRTPIHPPTNYWLQQLPHGGYAMPRNVTSQALLQMPRPRPLLSSVSPFIGSLHQNTSAFPRHPYLPLPTVSTSAGTAQWGSIQQQYLSQFQLQQSSTAKMRGPGNAFRVPVQVPNNSFRAPVQVPNNSFRAPQQMRPSQMQAYRESAASMPTPAAETVNVLKVLRTEDLLNVQSDQNWQPTARMRGSLSGQAHKAGHDQLVIRPTQTTAAPNQGNISHQLQMLLANRNPQSSQPNHLLQNKN